jgi:phosphate starvation-inducible membrane PsiE
MRMQGEKLGGKPLSGLVGLANRSFVGIEVVAYLALGVLLAIAALFGVISAALSLWDAVPGHDSVDSLLVAIDRMLLVLMIVEILHTVRASFRTGTLVCEPFLIVGLIASIRRILIITLQSSQASQPGRWTPESQEILHSTMLELAVLGGLILVMVISIYLLRRSDRAPVAG